MANVLIVDDDADTLDYLTAAIRKGGHHPIPAKNGWEGLLALDTHHVDAILLDLMMPGMDGGVFLNILRNDQRRQSIPVIVLTALRSGELFSRTLRLGVARCFIKADYQLTDLLDAINQTLTRPDPSAGGASGKTRGSGSYHN